MAFLNSAFRLLCATTFAWGVTSAAFAQQERWPNKPVRLVVTFPPGGASDVVARIIAVKLSASLGQPFLVDNRPGADGMIGSEAVSKAAPDGHVLLISNVGPQGIAQTLYRDIRYDAINDFTHIAHLGAIAHVLVVGAAFPAKNLQEFVQIAKTQPGKVDFGSGGPINQLTGELLKAKAGIQITNVPYKGTGQVLTELRGGMIPSAVLPLPSAIELMRAQQLRALAVTSAQRSPLAPDVPTFVELGYPDIVVENWVGISAPAKLRDDIVRRLVAEIGQLLAAEDVRAKMRQVGMTVQFKGPGEFTRYVRAEIEKWRSIIISSGMKIE